MSDWLEFFARKHQKLQKNPIYFTFGKLLESSVLVPISGVPPCESSRPEDYENVVVFGCGTFQRGVIAAQSQLTLKFWVRKRRHKKTTAV